MSQVTHLAVSAPFLNSTRVIHQKQSMYTAHRKSFRRIALSNRYWLYTK